MKTRVLCLGDSNTWGYNPANGTRFDEKTRWPLVLQEMLGGEYQIIEEGQNGRTFNTDDHINGYMSGNYILQPCLKSHDPLDYFVLMLGTNDLKKSYGLSLKDISENAEILFEKANRYWLDIARKTPKVLIISPPLITEALFKSCFSNDFEDEKTMEKSKNMSEYLRRVSDKKGYSFLDAKNYVKVGKIDGLHLDKEGHHKMARLVYDWIMGDI